jgi:hypothetical protein
MACCETIEPCVGNATGSRSNWRSPGEPEVDGKGVTPVSSWMIDVRATTIRISTNAIRATEPGQPQIARELALFGFAYAAHEQ